jgi:ubiquinone/menaquinone biosynthesis C-methylase UbiE
VNRATLDKDPREVASMFDAVARRYDLTNTVLSLGQDRSWRRATRSALRIGPGDKVLDLAAGTAVSTVELSASGAWCVAADFSVGMLAAGTGRRVPKVAGDATRLPFADGVFDAVTISFGLRNVVDHTAGLREMARVTRPGGRVGLQDQDFGMVAATHPDRDLTHHILDGVVKHLYEEPYSGRRLPGLLREAGLASVRLLTDVFQDTTLEPWTKTFLERRAEYAVSFGLVDAATAQRWLDGFTALVAAGSFVFTMNYYGAVGARP